MWGEKHVDFPPRRRDLHKQEKMTCFSGDSSAMSSSRFQYQLWHLSRRPNVNNQWGGGAWKRASSLVGRGHHLLFLHMLFCKQGSRHDLDITHLDAAGLEIIFSDALI